MKKKIVRRKRLSEKEENTSKGKTNEPKKAST